jgi:UDP-N-acetylglucosamine:LPS N-acetylglucosamine transferase
VLIKVRPKVILSAGAGIAVPACILGRLLGARIIHIESASRIHHLSATGRIMYHVAHLFFVQWEPLADKHPKAIFAGRLL